MKLIKPKFWDKKEKNFISLLLFPISLITLLIVFFKKHLSKKIKFNIPVICVGNIYVGGTGKTPAAIFLANELSKLGLNPVILRKFYRNHNDEYSQIRSNYKNLIITKNRIDGIKKAEKNGNNIVILDDGLQDYKIEKDLCISCFHQNQLVGNGLILPAGPLRENISALKKIQIVLINGDKCSDFEKKLKIINKDLEIYYLNYKPLNIENFKGHKLLAFAAIGNPENFFQLLNNNGLIIKKKLVYPDHYEFTKDEIQKIIDEADHQNLKIITTEKDFFKINNFNLPEINFLKVSLEFVEKEKFINRIQKII